ncbi:unnamed protein product [Owenia fusiformis]|uniref:BTB domain-containing protein n=1 Tax=Owenia fusiformis TaxID=6347 RepID=A0A8S4Q2C6_OWEFU|nr:unnamed protein product [Owenia fusiformis]
MEERTNNNSPVESSDLIQINVGGVKHEVLRSTLQRFPGTKLANLSNDNARKGSDFIVSRGEFYFDRHPGIFTTILNCYRTGELHMDRNACGCALAHELEFWGINEVAFQKCCTTKYMESEYMKTQLTLFEKTFSSEQSHYNREPGCGKLQEKIWAFLDNPFSSVPAKAFGVWTVLMIVLSIITLCLETVDGLKEEIGPPEISKITGIQEGVLRSNYSVVIHEGLNNNQTGTVSWWITDPMDSNNSKKVIHIGEHFHVPNSFLIYIDYVLFAYFSLELVTRFIFSPHKGRFWLSFYTFCDVIALIPGVVLYVTNFVHPVNKLKTSTLDIVRALGTARILRLLRFMRFSMACKLLLYTLMASIKEIFLMLGLLLLGAITFASLVYFGELISDSDEVLITNIPIGIWYAMVTMTTVGYGDFYPKSIGGYIVGSGCVICGVLVIAFTVPVIVNNFLMFYAHASSMDKKSERPFKNRNRDDKQQID